MLDCAVFTSASIVFSLMKVMINIICWIKFDWNNIHFSGSTWKVTLFIYTQVWFIYLYACKSKGGESIAGID